MKIYLLDFADLTVESAAWTLVRALSHFFVDIVLLSNNVFHSVARNKSIIKKYCGKDAISP